jgi:hypothetical protein
MSARPPWRSSHRPTGTAMTAPTRMEAVNDGYVVKTGEQLSKDAAARR